MNDRDFASASVRTTAGARQLPETNAQDGKRPYRKPEVQDLGSLDVIQVQAYGIFYDYDRYNYHA